MPSKGVQCYTYITVPGCSIELSVPNQTVVRNEVHTFWNEDLEVDSHNISSLFNKTGRFTFKVFRDGNQITEQWIDVNALTGNASGGTMETIANSPSILHDDIIVSYGFYEAGQGYGLLPNRHQCYVTVSPNYANWMGSVAAPGSPQEEAPFHRLVLPAVHDVGMNSMQSSEAVLKHAGSAVIGAMVSDNRIMGEIADAVSGKAVGLIAPNIIFSLAITQKDSLDTMLQLGARYFEFRPAHCHRDILPTNSLPDRLYFQHSAIPGMAYEQFLHDVVQFLLAHPTEIVAVQLRWDGVPNECARPSDQELEEYLNAALSQAHGDIAAGNYDDLRNQNIGQLRRDRKRLIMMVNVDSLSTYTDEGNATLNGDSIVSAFGTILSPENASGRGFVNIQCQATATNIPKAIVYSVLSASASTSCILATKGICDSKTLPWVRDNALRVCGDQTLVVVMNDFFDGATASVSVELSRQRLG
ncbi:PLC-like phosphodiesterase [Thozetella sp. PMI_491]|nr:PLC-like phosphodiesterase [Thozetella sp. PMI_491]